MRPEDVEAQQPASSPSEYDSVGLALLQHKLNKMPVQTKRPWAPPKSRLAPRHHMHGGRPLTVRNQTLMRFLMEGRER